MKAWQKAALLASVDGTPGASLVVEATGNMGSITLLDVHEFSGGGTGEED
jgi:hypothetical protein